MENKILLPHAAAIIRLLQGTVFDEDVKVWNELIIYQQPIRDYFRQIGIDLYLDESNGFSYLTQRDSESEDVKIPRLIRRMPLSYEITLLLTILRQSLEDFDVKNTEATKCFISHQEIIEKIELLFKEKADTVKLLARLESYINQVIQLGFLKEIHTSEIDATTRRFEIRRVIRAKINNEKLEEIKSKLEENGKPV
jgi:hypothetical protein